MVDEVVPDAVAAIGVIAPGVNSTHVSCFQRDVMDFIELDEMVVAGEENGAVGMVMDEVMRGTQPNSIEQHRRHITLRPAGPGERNDSFRQSVRRE